MERTFPFRSAIVARASTDKRRECSMSTHAAPTSRVGSADTSGKAGNGVLASLPPVEEDRRGGCPNFAKSSVVPTTGRVSIESAADGGSVGVSACAPSSRAPSVLRGVDDTDFSERRG